MPVLWGLDGISVGKLQISVTLHNPSCLPNPLSQYFNGKLLSVPGRECLSDSKHSPSAFLFVKWPAASYNWCSSALLLAWLGEQNPPKMCPLCPLSCHCGSLCHSLPSAAFIWSIRPHLPPFHKQCSPFLKLCPMLPLAKSSPLVHLPHSPSLNSDPPLTPT